MLLGSNVTVILYCLGHGSQTQTGPRAKWGVKK